MSIIDFEKFKQGKEQESDQQEGSEGPEVRYLEYEEDAEMADIVFLTRDIDGVVVLFSPNERYGSFLTPDQALELGTALIEHSAMARHRETLSQGIDTEDV